MAYVNEFASEEDVEKYHLRELWDKYMLRYKGDYFYGREPWFTIDREREKFLFKLGGGAVPPEYQQKFLFWDRGRELTAYVNRLPSYDDRSREGPMLIRWRCVLLEEGRWNWISDEEAWREIKVAIAAFGQKGVFSQREDVVVEFE